MFMRALAVILCLLLTAPVVGADYETGNEPWRDIEVDMSEWTDGPELEGSPMDNPRSGDAVLKIQVSYKPSHLASEVQGEIIIELFEESILTQVNQIRSRYHAERRSIQRL